MKVLYMGFIDINSDNHIGVRKKIFGQINAMKRNQLEVDYLLHNDNNLEYYSGDKVINLGKYTNTINRRMNMLSNNLIDTINKQGVDIIYIRYPLSDILFINFIKKLKQNNKKVYIEIPTYPYDSELKPTTLIIDKLFRSSIRKYTDYIVTSSGKYESIFNTPCKFIDNCVDFGDIKFVEHLYDENKKEINLISVAFLNYWHGYDRVIEGLYEYYKEANNKYDIKFIIVGHGGDYCNLKELVKKYNLNDKVKFMGIQNGMELDRLFEKSDIAISSIAIHRKNMSSVSSLKSREYCARGIPFIYAGDDPGFLGLEEFLLQIGSDDSYIDMNNIITFYNKLSNIKDVSNKMRLFAEKNFKWDVYYKNL